jgi:hypothetical protein
LNGNNPPPWQAHISANYDEIMTARCAEVLIRLRDNAAYRVQIRSDPRPLHRYLFHGFTPNDYGEYAGTYRGQQNTSLFGRISIAESALTVDERYRFCAPEEVGGRMQALSAAVADMMAMLDLIDDGGELAAHPASRTGGDGRRIR